MLQQQESQPQRIFRYATLAGQDQARRILLACRQRAQVAHAWLLHGEEGLGMELMGMAFARALLCSGQSGEACEHCSSCLRSDRLDHPDLLLVTPLPSAASAKSRQEAKTQEQGADEDGEKGRSTTNPADLVYKEFLAALDEWRAAPFGRPQVKGARQISVEQARHMKSWASVKSFEGQRRVCLVLEADKLGLQAQNALLKLLEEPPEDLVLVLCSSRPEGLLPTIHSRCQQLRLRPVARDRLLDWMQDQPSLAGRDHALLAQMSGGIPGRVFELAAQLDDEPEAQDPDTPSWEPQDFVRNLFAKRSRQLHRTVVMLDGSRDRERVVGFLEALQDWFLDLELVRALGPEDSAARMRRPLELQAMQAMCTRYRLRNPQRLMDALMEASRLIRANVNMFATLTVLAQRLQRELERIGTR